jgi:hypothetical protein
VAAADRLRVGLLVELLGQIFADDLEHRESRLGRGLRAVVRDRPDEALVDQRGKAVERVDPELVPEVAHLLGRLERPTAGEHRQTGEQPSFSGIEQLVAPVDRGMERPLAGGDVPGSCGEDRQASLQPVEDRRRAQILHPCGGELDPQRQAVEPPRDLGHRARVVVRHGEARRDGARALDE